LIPWLGHSDRVVLEASEIESDPVLQAPSRVTQLKYHDNNSLDGVIYIFT